MTAPFSAGPSETDREELMPHQTMSMSETTRPRMYPPHLQPMMQETLRTLANMDFEHETDLARLIESGMARP